MSKNHFYEKKGPFPLSKIIKTISCTTEPLLRKNLNITGFEPLNKAKVNNTALPIEPGIIDYWNRIK